jgi:very-short-patch-repair endonuclease
MRAGEKRTRGFAKQMRRAMPGAETLLWSRLRIWPGIRFRRQHPIGPYVADFACVAAHLIVEVDGETHGGESERKHDEMRDAYLRQRGWKILRVYNRDVYGRLDDVLETIGRLLPPPPLRGPADTLSLPAP